ncbi:MAG: hypothetical protein NTV81_02035, partial [Candidatus Komeilibacteria bacterium]|nr:hypothetical protein [Candidatus Komeilibacteria bacterium]
AKTLGLKQAHFVGPSGLEVDNQASLEDVIGLAQIIFGKKEVQAATSQPQGTINAQSAGISKIISFDNTDKLIDESLTVIAGKTGTLDQAGFSVAALVSQTGTRPVLVIILGAKDHFARFAEARNLAEWAWKNY